MSDPTPAVTNAAGSDAAPSLNPAQPATRCSGRKCKQRELQDGVGDWTEALKLCVCGYSAEPLDDADAPNVAQCRKEGCETKWVRLIFRAARRARRAGSTGPVRRVADPFRRGFQIFFDGTATGRLYKPTAGETTAGNGQRAGNKYNSLERIKPSGEKTRHQERKGNAGGGVGDSQRRTQFQGRPVKKKVQTCEFGVKSLGDHRGYLNFSEIPFGEWCGLPPPLGHLYSPTTPAQ
ncbi:hypothetical protein B0H10DRAFT_1966072 [Mycena sp. CBHHK59/15]|nr:hypothetical protein B0H10DRAFT_1966072 [Mycena sp. CBHHK59/15]